MTQPSALQVLRAQAAGAMAAIVYDDAYEPLVIMDKLANMPEPGIPAIFVSQQTGVVMNRLLKAGTTAAILLPVRLMSSLLRIPHGNPARSS